MIAPGGSHPGRAWPINHFVDLARRLMRDRTLSLVAMGGPADAAAVGRIAAVGVLDLPAGSTLRQSIAVISRADLVIANSSFAMHAAAASSVPAIVLLGERHESARAHAAQWGHGELTTMLGRDRERPKIVRAGRGVIEVVAGAPRQLVRIPSQ